MNERGQVLEIRTHASLGKNFNFEGRKYRSDEALEWIRTLTNEMKGTCKPQNDWWKHVSLSLEKRPRSGTDSCWRKRNGHGSCLAKRFSSTTIHSTISRQYLGITWRCQEYIHVCDVLLHSNKYTCEAQIQYEKAGAESEDYVEIFLLNGGDDDLMDFIYPQRLADIHRVEHIIASRLVGKKGKQKRGRMSSSRLSDPHRYESRINRRRDSGNDSSRRSDRRRDNKIDVHRFIPEKYVMITASILEKDVKNT